MMAVETEAQTSTSDSKLHVSRDEGLVWLRSMMLIRRFEERAEEAYGKAKIGGFLHLRTFA